jgi:hypothetical protein
MAEAALVDNSLELQLMVQLTLEEVVAEVQLVLVQVEKELLY